jgi:hypothetical protein
VEYTFDGGGHDSKEEELELQQEEEE